MSRKHTFLLKSSSSPFMTENRCDFCGMSALEWGMISVATTASTGLYSKTSSSLISTCEFQLARKIERFTKDLIKTRDGDPITDGDNK